MPLETLGKTSRSLDQDLVNLFDVSREGFAAIQAGNLALLGVQRGEQTVSPELYDGSIAELLLSSPSTAIMHVEEPQEEWARGVMIAANYHHGHSEGFHKVIVQDPAHPEMGQWELFVPPGSDNRTFYKRTSYRGSLYPFEKVPTNPGKIDNFFVHIGKADAAIRDFENAGFKFVDEPMSEELVYELENLSYADEHRWVNPIAG